MRFTLITLLLFCLVYPELGAQNEIVYGSTQNEVNYTALSYLKKPTGLQASKGTYAYSVSVKWTGYKDVTGYHLYRTLDAREWGIKPLRTIKDTEANVFVYDLNVRAGIVYFYRSQSYKDTLKSKFSNIDKGWLAKGDIALTPTLLLPDEDLTSKTVQFAWSPIPGTTGYQIQVISKDEWNWTDSTGFTNNPNLELDTVVNTTSFQWTAPRKESYLWTVRGIGSQGEFIYSFPKSLYITTETDQGFALSVRIPQLNSLTLNKTSFQKGETALITTPLFNREAEPVESVRALYFLSEDQVWDNNDLKIGETDFGEISGQTPKTITSAIRIPDFIASGTYYLLVLPESELYVDRTLLQIEAISVN